MLTITSKQPTTREGVTIHTRAPCLVFKESQICILEVQCRDTTAGAPVDLQSIIGDLEGVEAVFVFRDGAKPTVLRTIPAVVVDAANGLVRATLASNSRVLAGVYELGVMLKQGSSIVYQYDGYAIVEPNPLAATTTGPPLVASIRTAIRDTGPLDNSLWEDFACSDSEVAHALIATVSYWNSLSPVLDPVGTTQFNYQNQWRDAAIGRIYGTLADDYRRNQGTYQSSGGFTFQEGEKANPYTQLAQQRMSEFTAWAQQERTNINMMSFFGGSRSPFPNSRW